MRIEIKPRDNLTIQLDNKGFVDVLWSEQEKKCTVAVRWNPSIVNKKVRDREDKMMGLPDVVIDLEEKAIAFTCP